MFHNNRETIGELKTAKNQGNPQRGTCV